MKLLTAAATAAACLALPRLVHARAVLPATQAVIRPDDGADAADDAAAQGVTRNSTRQMQHMQHPLALDPGHVISSSSPLLALHRSLAEIESVTGNEREVGLWLAKYLRQQGFVVQLQPVEGEDDDPIDPDLELDPYLPPSRFNVYAHRPETPAPEVILSSHIDTVPPFIPYSVSVEPAEPSSQDDSVGEIDARDLVIRGRGSVDAKACVAAQIIAATSRLDDDPTLPLGLLFVVGEETGGRGMKAFARSSLNANPSTFHTVIFGEPTEHKLVSGHKGIVVFGVTAHGKAAHSGYPWLGRSAVSDILPILSRIDVLGDVPESEGGLPSSAKFGKTTVNVGQVRAGVAANVLPETATAKVALRLASGTPDEARAIVRKAVEAAAPVGSNITLDFTSYGAGWQPVEIDADVDGFDVMTVNYFTDVP
ncbi:hypothetical protein KEM52_002861, partial [Ascosphaera acerosa]